MKSYKFDKYTIVIYTKEDLPLPPARGLRSLCYNNVRTEQAIEIQGEGIKPREGDWFFCHLIDHVQRWYNVVVEEIKTVTTFLSENPELLRHNPSLPSSNKTVSPGGVKGDQEEEG